MPSEDKLQKFAPIVLRYGLVALFLWFGFSQILTPNDWISWVPGWVPDTLHMDAKTIVLLNGAFEVIFGALLFVGLYIRFVAAILGLHLLLIAYEIGYNDIGVRDFALAIMCFSAALFNGDQWVLKSKIP